MLKYKLVNPIIINGIQYYQIQALRPIKNKIRLGDLGGYIDSLSSFSQGGEGWIYPNSYVTNSDLRGDITIMRNCTVTDSTLIGKFALGNRTVIDNCILRSLDDWCAVTELGTVIQDKNFVFGGLINNSITNSKYWNVYTKNNITVLCGESYCKTGCMTLSYRKAWEALTKQNDIIEEHYQSSVKNVLRYTIPENIEWLKAICKKELNRLNIKIEEGT